MDFGNKLRELRMEKKMLQKEMADILNVSCGTISNYEKNVHFPDGHTLCKIADYFGVSIDYLMGRTSLRHSLEILNQEISDGYPLSQLVNKIVALDIQQQRELRQYTEYLASISKKQPTGKRKHQNLPGA